MQLLWHGFQLLIAVLVVVVGIIGYCVTIVSLAVRQKLARKLEFPLLLWVETVL